MSGGGFLQNYMRLFGQEGLGRPDLEADSEINSLRKFLATELSEDEIPAINAALVFTDEGVEIDVEGAPLPTLPLKKLKELMRNKAKEKPVSATSLERVKAVLPG